MKGDNLNRIEPAPLSTSSTHQNKPAPEAFFEASPSTEFVIHGRKQTVAQPENEPLPGVLLL